MLAIVPFLLKSSISLAVLFLFYRLVLRPLTFYQWNRIYLLGFALMSFVLPFMDISSLIPATIMNRDSVINTIPSLVVVMPEQAGLKASESVKPFRVAHWVTMIYWSGVVVISVKLFVQLLALQQVRRKAAAHYEESGTHFYELHNATSPFSFGRSIYFHPQAHPAEDLERILVHERVHVTQSHTLDLIAGELLVMFNWYNPFAWLIRRAIRQNLEFIADDTVLRSGADTQQYQYLLLQVMQPPILMIVHPFNIFQLKQRIMMMNQPNTSRKHLLKFLLILPLLALVLAAFRSNGLSNGLPQPMAASNLLSDTIPDTLVPGQPRVVGASPKVNKLNFKGYLVTVADNAGECIVIVKDRQLKIVKAVTLMEWNQRERFYEGQYGEIAPVAAPTLQPSGAQARPQVKAHPAPKAIVVASPVINKVPDSIATEIRISAPEVAVDTIITTTTVTYEVHRDKKIIKPVKAKILTPAIITTPN